MTPVLGVHPDLTYLEQTVHHWWETNHTYKKNLDFVPNGILKRISLLLNWNLKYLNTWLKIKKNVLLVWLLSYLRQRLEVVISVGYILNIIKRKIFITQACVAIAKFWHTVETRLFSFAQRLSNILIMSVPHEWLFHKQNRRCLWIFIPFLFCKNIF